MGLIGFYAGSFDPFTNGHLAIVKKSAKSFEKVIIGIGHNPEKKPRIDREKMKAAIEETIREENLNNVEVVIYEGLTVDKAKQMNSNILIRGLRNGTDYEYEENISAINEKISGIDTCYFRAGDLGYLSSSIVMELYNNGKVIDDFVPKPIAQLLNSIK